MFHSKCLYSNILPNQVIIWEEKPSGLEVCISTPLSLSGLAREGLEIFSEHISSLMLEISAISTMVRHNRIKIMPLHIKAKRRVVLCLFTQKHFVCCQKPAALTCIFDRLPVVYLALSIISSTTCRKESQEGNSSVCEQVMFADQCVTNTCFLTPFEGRMKDDVLVGFWCLLG